MLCFVASCLATNLDSLMLVHKTDSVYAAKIQLQKDSITNHLQHIQNVFKSWKVGNIDFNNSQKNRIPASQIETEINHNNNDWLFFILIGLLIFFSIVRHVYKKEFEDLFSVFKSINRNQQVFRNQTSGVPWVSVLLNLFSVAVITIYLWLAMQMFNLKMNVGGYYLLLIISAIVIAIIFVRFLSIQISGIILSGIKEISFYSFYELQLLRILSFGLLPVIPLIAYGNVWVKKIVFTVSLVLIGAFFLFRLLRGLQIGGNFLSKNIFHFIIYICALEIAPLLLLIKFFLKRPIH